MKLIKTLCVNDVEVINETITNINSIITLARERGLGATGSIFLSSTNELFEPTKIGDPFLSIVLKDENDGTTVFLGTSWMSDQEKVKDLLSRAIELVKHYDPIAEMERRLDELKKKRG